MSQVSHRTASLGRFNSHYDENPEYYDRLRTCWLNTRREAFISARLIRYQLPANALVLEIGSGTGKLLNSLGRRFPSLSFVGIEPIAGYVEYARITAPENVRYVVRTLDEAGRANEGGALVVLSNDVLHHLPSYEGAVEAAHRLAASGCRWLALEPNAKNPYSFLRQGLGYGERNFWPRPFRHCAEQEGWRAVAEGHLFLVPPFITAPPFWMKRLERMLERVPVLAGGVYLELRLQSRD